MPSTNCCKKPKKKKKSETSSCQNYGYKREIELLSSTIGYEPVHCANGKIFTNLLLLIEILWKGTVSTPAS